MCTLNALQPQPLENLILCQKCRVRHVAGGGTEMEALPDAVVFQFENKTASRTEGFRAAFTFSLTPTDGEEPTVTRMNIPVDDDSKMPIPVVCGEKHLFLGHVLIAF